MAALRIQKTEGRSEAHRIITTSKTGMMAIFPTDGGSEIFTSHGLLISHAQNRGEMGWVSINPFLGITRFSSLNSIDDAIEELRPAFEIEVLES